MIINDAQNSKLWGSCLVDLPLKDLGVDDLCHLYAYFVAVYGENNFRSTEVIKEAISRQETLQRYGSPNETIS